MQIADVLKIFKRKEVTDDRLGGFLGVFIPGIVTMFGVIIFLRFGFLLGNLGLAKTFMLVSFSFLISIVTALSISSISTNMRLSDAGTYIMISRIFGIHLGSSIGIALFLRQTIGIILCTLGFTESFVALFPFIPTAYVNIATVVLITLLLLRSMHATLKIELVIFFLIIAAFISLFMTTGYTGPVNTPFTGQRLSFWTAFAIFYPASTGIEVGLSLSGRLKNPAKAIPFGTLMTVGFGLCTYLIYAFFLTNHVSLDVLIQDPLILLNLARFKFVIFIGIWVAALSSVIGDFIASATTLQALARDRILPRFLAKSFFKKNEPHVAILVTMCIVLYGVLSSTLDQTAQVLTMFGLICYLLLNLGAGLESLLDNPSWRPSFRVPWFISIFGAALCLFAMFMINSSATFIALFFVLFVYVIMKKRGLGSHFDDITQGILLYFSRLIIHKLAQLKPEARTWRPNFLAFTQSPSQLIHSDLMHFTSALTQKKGFLTMASVLKEEVASQDRRMGIQSLISESLKKSHIHALVEVASSKDYYSGLQKLITSYGMGPLTPNTIVLPMIENKEGLESTAKAIQLSIENGRNVILMKESGKPLVNEKKIDLWWDDDSKENSDLMVLLSYMLQNSLLWKHASISVRSFASNEIGRKGRLEFFTNFFEKGRMLVDVDVLVCEEDKQLEMLSKLSKDAPFVFMGLKKPNKEEELESYISYLERLYKKTKTFDRIAFVLSTGHVDLREIFQ